MCICKKSLYLLFEFLLPLSCYYRGWGTFWVLQIGDQQLIPLQSCFETDLKSLKLCLSPFVLVLVLVDSVIVLEIHLLSKVFLSVKFIWALLMWGQTWCMCRQTTTCGWLGFLSVTTDGYVMKKQSSFLFFILDVLRVQFMSVTVVFIPLHCLSQNGDEFKQEHSCRLMFKERHYYDFSLKGQVEPQAW